MSKKVLNYAGQRPMLLALIVMATLTLGLLFSGWLTPTPGRAQQDAPEPMATVENTNCPNYVCSTNASCPSITNYGSINSNSFCFSAELPVPMPQLTNQPEANSGQQIIITTETCSNTVTSTTNTITESFSGLQYNPPPPSGSIMGTFSSDCYVMAAPSDTNDCSAQKIDYGNIVWNIFNSFSGFENVVGTGSGLFGLGSGPWSAPNGFGGGASNTDGKTYSFTSVTIWNSDSTWYNNTCNTVAYNDHFTGSDVSNAGKIYLWFQVQPGNYVVTIGWTMTLKATGPNGRALLTLTDASNNNNITNNFITTSQSPWSSANNTYDINVTTADSLPHLILIYNPTLNFNNESPAHIDTGTAEGNPAVTSIRCN